MVYLSHWYGNKKTKVQSFGLSIFTEKIKDVFFTVLPGEKEESSLLKLHNVGVEYSSRFSTLFFFLLVWKCVGEFERRLRRNGSRFFLNTLHTWFNLNDDTFVDEIVIVELNLNI